MKLLIAVDSALSTEVLVHAVMMQPWPDGTTVNVLSVVVDAEVPEEVWREEGYGTRAVRREMKRRGEQITALSVDRLGEVGIPAEVLVTRGDPRHLIPFFARKWSSDVIFVGAHVIKSLEHWMLGSVARAVVATAPCSVQIVRDQRNDRADNHTGRRVLLATDGSETSAEAARAIAGRLWPDGSEFRVISVEEPWAIKPSKVREEKEAHDTVSDAKEVLVSAGLKPTGAVLSGNTRGAILKDAKEWSADLIFVGSHGRRGFKRFLLGSVSEGVAMDAHCAVVVVRGRQKIGI